MKRVLVTGGCGFIGSNFIRLFLGKLPDVQLVNFDKLTYAGNKENLKDLDADSRYSFMQADISNPKAAAEAMKGSDLVVHFAAESHVDRSILDAADFLKTNIIGTQTLLEAARDCGVKRFVHISTDEVYGSLLEGAAEEGDPLSPNSPYAASKASAEHFVRAHHVTYGLPTVVVRGTNNFGPYQFPEKFVPLMITNAMANEPLPVYGDGKYVREWIHVEDFCEAILLAAERGTAGEIYNAGSGEHRENMDVIATILKMTGKPPTLIRHVTDRLGHDRRYAVNSEKIRSLGWVPKKRFDRAIEETIRWYETNRPWWQPLKARVVASR